MDHPPEQIILKSFEVLAKITIPVDGELQFDRRYPQHAAFAANKDEGETNDDPANDGALFPMTDYHIEFALDILEPNRRQLKSRDREVFSALIELHSHHHHLLPDLSRVIAFMCRLQPPEFVFVSFAVELERFVRRRSQLRPQDAPEDFFISQDLEFVSSFVQQMCHVLLNAKEADALRKVLKDCIGDNTSNQIETMEKDRRRGRLFHILLHSFAHNLVSTTALCMWAGALRTASLFLQRIDPLDIHLMFLLELDKLVETIEKPLFRYVVFGLVCIVPPSFLSHPQCHFDVCLQSSCWVCYLLFFCFFVAQISPLISSNFLIL